MVLLGTDSAILRNAIFSNDGLGINLGTDGVTPNDAGDSDTGPNNLQNYPRWVSRLNSNTVVAGEFHGAPNSTLRVEFFTDEAYDPTGHGEGKTFVGSKVVTTDATGNVSFSSPISDTAEQYITATATDPNNNTSE